MKRANECKDCKYCEPFDDDDWPYYCDYPIPFWVEDEEVSPLISGHTSAQYCACFEAAKKSSGSSIKI